MYENQNDWDIIPINKHEIKVCSNKINPSVSGCLDWLNIKLIINKRI